MSPLVIMRNHSLNWPRQQHNASVAAWNISYFSEINTLTAKAETRISKIKLFPLPAENYLNVNLSKDVPVIEVSISSIEGKNIQPEYQKTGNGNLRIDIRNLKPGFYILHIQDEETTYADQFLVK